MHNALCLLVAAFTSWPQLVLLVKPGAPLSIDVKVCPKAEGSLLSM